MFQAVRLLLQAVYSFFGFLYPIKYKLNLVLQENVFKWGHHNERPSYKIWVIINNILFKGHDYSVDLWALGIFIYEMTQGESPFRDPKETIKKRYLNFAHRWRSFPCHSARAGARERKKEPMNICKRELTGSSLRKSYQQTVKK